MSRSFITLTEWGNLPEIKCRELIIKKEPNANYVSFTLVDCDLKGTSLELLYSGHPTFMYTPMEEVVTNFVKDLERLVIDNVVFPVFFNFSEITNLADSSIAALEIGVKVPDSPAFTCIRPKLKDLVILDTGYYANFNEERVHPMKLLNFTICVNLGHWYLTSCERLTIFLPRRDDQIYSDNGILFLTTLAIRFFEHIFARLPDKIQESFFRVSTRLPSENDTIQKFHKMFKKASTKKWNGPKFLLQNVILPGEASISIIYTVYKPLN